MGPPLVVQSELATKLPLVTDLELCLEFADMVDWRTSDHPTDPMGEYSSLVEWSKKKGLVTGNEEKKLIDFWRNHKSSGDKVTKQAYELREAIYRIFSAVAHGRRADPKDVDTLNEHIGRSMTKLALETDGESYGWGWKEHFSPDMMLWPIADSAAELLTSEDLNRVRECANEEQGCGSLFLDESKSQTKKWCSMDTCGNRVKFHTYYEKHKA